MSRGIEKECVWRERERERERERPTNRQTEKNSDRLGCGLRLRCECG